MARKVAKKNRKCRFQCTSLKSCFVVLLVLSLAVSLCAGPVRSDFEREAKAEIERLDPFMGDWQGGWKLDDGTDSG
ncbi:MAG TPA: hypothetical protein VMY06_00160, partial [Sedimentisphaerales bacterium]|nr:hypothetical protein [Sedimentisphaerales bacterium]